MPWRKRFRAVPAGLAVLLAVGMVQAAKISDVRNTPHNLSVTGTGTLKAASETQVCVFCHTPHSADITVPSPLWNRKLSSATYTPYTSSSIEASAAEMAAAPGGSSKLCLSCHDGTMAIDTVNVLNGASNPTIAMTLGGVATSPAYMPPGSGATTGYTRNLGINLSNDHPISFTYNSTLATNDGELRAPDGTVVGNRVAGVSPKPKMPLENNQLQCATCHDPHLKDTVDANAKFLRMNRLQTAQPGASFNQSTDIVCLACHDKGGLSWAYSTHANSQVGTQTYTAAAAAQRQFPATTQIWQAACLNCHDTHTVQGARRLLREGTDSAASPKTGGSSALEETCYQCHTTTAASAVTGFLAINDIKTSFALPRHMPIKSSEQAAGTEVHDIGGNFNDGALANCANTPTPTGQCGKDLLESRDKLGVILSNRHAECSDCHNPHRVVNFRDFRGNPAGTITGAPDGVGTHPHVDSSMLHTNIASGALRGSWGVEPTYPSSSFHAMPSAFTVKRGDPGTNSNSAVSATYVTREYQVCLKCHSNYGYADNNVYPTGNRPLLGSPGTPSGTMNHTQYTNQAKEFQAPATHQGEPLSLGTDAGSTDGSARFNTNNHRSWHPVMGPTGRTTAARGITSTNIPFLQPWKDNVGTQTMYCTDCHGENVTSLTSVIPDNAAPAWGTHGSSNNFMLKGEWADSTATVNRLCFKCHDKNSFVSSGGWGSGGSTKTSGFSNSSYSNLHQYHTNRVSSELRCTWCHVLVPHGWKNKAFLVNLNDVGEEAGQGAGSSKEVAINSNAGNYTKEPYYFKAKNKIKNFKASGNWLAGDCGSVGKTGTGLTTGIIPNSQGGTGNNTNAGGCMSWMGSTCKTPP
ncbi:MAG: cytochrome c3 family protein [Sulfuricella sp.]